MSLQPTTLASITRIFDSLDYAALGPIYCDEGGDAFWEERRGPCQGIGIKLAPAPRDRPRPSRRSLYVGARGAELPSLLMGTAELHPMVAAYKLRANEAAGVHPPLPTP